MQNVFDEFYRLEFVTRRFYGKIVIVIVFETCARLFFLHAPAQFFSSKQSKTKISASFYVKTEQTAFDNSFSQDLVSGDELKGFSKVFFRHSVNKG